MGMGMEASEYLGIATPREQWPCPTRCKGTDDPLSYLTFQQEDAINGTIMVCHEIS
jgi:hypothetical protein